MEQCSVHNLVNDQSHSVVRNFFWLKLTMLCPNVGVFFSLSISIQQSLVRHKMLNDQERRNGGTARFGVNKFSDLTPKEFQGGSHFS